MMLLACMDTWLMDSKPLFRERKAITVPRVIPPSIFCPYHSCTHQSRDGIADIAKRPFDPRWSSGWPALHSASAWTIQLAEAFQGLLLMGKDLDHLLASIISSM